MVGGEFRIENGDQISWLALVTGAPGEAAQRRQRLTHCVFFFCLFTLINLSIYNSNMSVLCFKLGERVNAEKV